MLTAFGFRCQVMAQFGDIKFCKEVVTAPGPCCGTGWGWSVLWARESCAGMHTPILLALAGVVAKSPQPVGT